MGLSGTLEDFNPIELIAVLDLLKKSGRLHLAQGDEEGLVVFRHGKIIYASSSGFRESLGSMLLARGLVGEEELVEALAKQVADSKERRLGAILIDMGALSEEALDSVMLEQVVRRVSEFSHWESGDFEFKRLHIENHGEVELQAGDLWAPLGLSSDAVLLRLAQDQDETVREASRKAEEQQSREEPEAVPEPELALEVADYADAPEVADSFDAPEPIAQESVAATSLTNLVSEQRGPQVKGEWMQRLLEQSGETFGRCVLFSARRDGFRAIAQTGEALPKPSGETPMLKIALSRTLPSLLGRSIAAGQAVTARLPQDEGDQAILDALGGSSDGESVAMPLSVRGETVLILYGDHLLEGQHSGRLENLESFIDQVSRWIEADIEAEIAAEISAA